MGLEEGLERLGNTLGIGPGYLQSWNGIQAELAQNRVLLPPSAAQW